MSAILKNNFFLNARGLTFADGGGVTWAINKNTNAISATITGASAWPINTGWGVPTGGIIENNFAGGSASLAVTSAAVAEIIAVLKSAGIIGA